MDASQLLLQLLWKGTCGNPSAVQSNSVCAVAADVSQLVLYQQQVQSNNEYSPDNVVYNMQHAQQLTSTYFESPVWKLPVPVCHAIAACTA